MTHFSWEPIYASTWAAMLFAAATVAVIVYVTPPTEHPSKRRTLIALRCVAALALLAVVFRPALVRTDKRPAEATLVVAADTSRSMTLPDGEGSDRWSTQVKVWKRLANGLEGLDESLAVRLLVYDADARVLTESDRDALEQQPPDGALTDLAAAAIAAMQSSEGKPLAGLVLLGDGTQTAPIQGTGAQRVIETLNSIGVPLWTVPIGPAGGDSDARDVSITALPESYQLFAGNEVSIDFQVLTRGLTGVEVPVRISWIDSQGQTDEAAIRTVVPTRSDDDQPLSIPLVAPSPGTYRLKVEADSQPGELMTVDNQQIAFVEVREGGGRILLLEGTLREEQLRIRQALRRFSDLEVNYRWIPADTVARWPVDLGDWFEPGRFDVYIIGDLDAAALGSEQLQQLTEAVAQGAGLVMLGGLNTYGGGGYADSPLAAAIPVRMDATLRRRVGSLPDEKGQLEPPVRVELARLHPISNLGGSEPAELWRELPPQLGANRFQGPKIAPGVQVILESPDEDPLLVVGEYGSGRTAAVAFDSTYRWWRTGQRDVHRRFWRQLVLWLLDREDTSDETIRVELDSRRFDRTEPPRFRADVGSGLDGEAPSATLVVEVIDEAGQSIEVPYSSDSAAAAELAISGTLPELETGFYRLVVRPQDDSLALIPGEVAFQVIDQSREMARPMADPVYLRQLAQLTAEQGGAAFAPDQVDRLIETIAERRRQSDTPIVEKYRLGDGPLSGWLVFLLFAGALACEWFLRRKWGIV